MKQFKTILKFELDNYFKSKSYIISTIIICILAAGIMFAPRIKDAFKSGSSSSSSSNEENIEDLTKYAIYDATGIAEEESLKDMFADIHFVFCDSADQVKEMVKSEEAKKGFIVNSLTSFDYVVFNNSMMDQTGYDFKEYMALLNKMDYCRENNLNIDEFLAMEYQEIEMNEEILGKDSASNYWYCYALVIIIFMLIVMYGMTIASSVTNEKSNRSIEILVTSTSSTAILFGKVIAGAIATIFQVGLIGGSLIGSYQFNKAYWSSTFQAIFDIPSNVLVTFAIFGIGGFLVYAFMYGALGALVSKIEDLNKTAGTAQMIVTLVYVVSLINLMNVDGVIIKVLSFLPISSYSAMFARVAMGNVAVWEVIVSAVILYAKVSRGGIMGGKIFRSATLRYGNPIKLSNALKGMKKEK